MDPADGDATACGSRADDAAARRALAVLAGLQVDAADPADEFELQHAEGAGASGRVFRACRRSDPSVVVALKVIPIPPLPAEGTPGSGAAPPAAVAAVAREIAFLRACDHPNVVAFRGAYYKAGALWLAMEHCAGGSAASVRARGPLNERQIAVVLCGALRGLAYLHARRKLHRDVKGANILLTRSGRVKLADFGVSAQLPGSLLASGEELDGEEQRGETPPPFQRGTFVGTPYWMSPEMIQDGAYDHKADIWSLGVTAIELADREPPLFREHPMRALLQIPRNAPPTVREPSQWSADFLDFVAFVLRKNPRERPTAAECLRHAFLRHVEHVDSVFEADGVAVEAVGEAPTGTERAERSEHELEPVEKISPLEIAESRVEVEIADALTRLDGEEDTDCGDAMHKSGVDGPPAADASISSLTSCSSTREQGGDELLDLSVDEGGDADASTDHPSARIAMDLPLIKATPAPTLTPARVDSPVRRSRQRLRSESAGAVSDALQASSALSELSMELHAPLNAVASDSKALSSNPLAQITASDTSERVSALLASLSSSHVGALLANSVTESSTNTTGSVVHMPAHEAPPPPATLLRRSSFSLSVTSSFREALANSQANSVSAAVDTSGLVPSQWRELQPRQFGAPLDDLQTVSCIDTGGDVSVPVLLHLLRRELLLRDALHSTHWIYRASPDARELERARTAIDRGTGFDADAVVDANVFAGLLKLWLRELPAPLLSPMRPSDVKRLAQLASALPDDGDERERAPTRLPLAEVHGQVERALGDVRGRRRAVFEWLLDHWLEVLVHSPSNRMTAHALSVVFAPSVYPCDCGLTVGRDTLTSTAAVGDVVAMLRVAIHWRRSCRDTGFAQVVERLESAATSPQVASLHGDREVTTGHESAALVWPAGGKCGEAKLGTAPGPTMGSFQSRQSVEMAVKECVRRAAGLPSGSNDEGGEDHASKTLEHERFVAFQRSVADALITGAKTSDERAFARRFQALVIPHESASLTNHSTDTWEQLRCKMPGSMTRLERWLAAAVKTETFQEVVRSEREVFDKRRRLRELQARGDRPQGSYIARISSNGSGLSLLQDLKRRYLSQRDMVGSRVLDGAQRMVETRLRCRRQMKSGSNNAIEVDTTELASLGVVEPLVEVLLLAALDQHT